MSHTWVQLGRTGDILNILPLLYVEALAGNRQRLMVGREYAALLDGVGYVDRVVFDGEAWELRRAVEQASQLGTWLCTQVNAGADDVREFVYGPAKMETSKTTSFQKEQWRVAGRLSKWDECLPLVFDKRDKDREAALLEEWMPSNRKKYLLVASYGISSPFPYRELLMELVKHCGYTVIDLSQVQAERFYDLLALYEKAFALVAIDSAHLHLAWACPRLPVLALANDKPLLWNGSSWRPNFEWYCRYSDFPMRSVSMVDKIRSMATLDRAAPKRVFLWDGSKDAPLVPEAPWNDRLPILPGMCARLGPPDKPQTPYLRDVLRMGIQRAGQKGAVALVRPKTIVQSAEVPPVPCYSYRLTRSEDSQQFSPIVDFFSAPAAWWKHHLAEIPDLLLGSDYHWSHALWTIFSKAGDAVDATGLTVREVTPQATKTEVSPATAFNQKTAADFTARCGVSSRYPKISEQLEALPLSRHGLMPFAYNPTVIEHEGFLVLASRYHPEATPATKIVLSQVNLDGSVVTNKVLDLDCISAEDPKFFLVDHKIHMSYVASSIPFLPIRSVVRYTEILNGKPQGLITPKLAGNDNSTIQKNWVFWQRGERLLCLFECHPVQRVFEFGYGWWNTEGPKWPYGPIKGGTAPIETSDAYLRFFHSTLDNEPTGHHRRYYVGAYLMKKEPPYEVLKVSSRPILYGSEIDDLKVRERPHHWKANVIFPGGVIQRDDYFILAVGVNDSGCLLVKVPPEKLNL